MANLKELRADNDGQLPAFAWPGGYPMYYLTRSGLSICAVCASEPDTSDPVVDGDTYMEGPGMQCEDCGQVIDSAYGDPDAYAEIDVSERRGDGHEYGVGNRISCYSAQEVDDRLLDVIKLYAGKGYEVTEDKAANSYRHIHLQAGALVIYIGVDFR